MANSLNNGDRNYGGPPIERAGDDLIWTAYQYTADELPEPSARAFEAALETDQRAREALSEAVALGDTIRAALAGQEVAAPAVMPASLVASSLGASTPSSNRNASYSRVVASVAFGAAACLALTMAFRTTPPADAPVAQGPAAPATKSEGRVVNPDGSDIKPDGGDVKPDGMADHELLAVLWPEGSADLTSGDAGSTSVVGIDVTDSAVDAELTANDDVIYEPMPDAAAPDWLIAAVFEDGE